MNPRLLPLLAAALTPLAAHAKPPPPSPRPSSSPSPVVADEGSASLLRWLLLQNGGSTAAAVPWPEIVRAVSGKQVTPLDPTNAPDAAALAKLGAALDALLPRLNRPDASLHAALTVTEVNARVADELRTLLAAESLAAPVASCPVLRWSESPGGRTFYLVVAAYPTGSKDAARALSVRPADLAAQITGDGTCLLVGLEHGGKPGRDLALLNWELIDLARVSLRCTVTFEGDASAVHASGTTLGDGRRGRD